MRPLTSDRTLTSTRVITKDRGDDYLSVGLPAEKEPLVQILLNNRPMSLGKSIDFSIYIYLYIYIYIYILHILHFYIYITLYNYTNKIKQNSIIN